MQAMYYVLTGETFDAQLALAMGVVSKVVPHDQLMASAEETAGVIAQWSPLVVRYAKDCVDEAVEKPLHQLAQTDQLRNFTLYSSGGREEGHKAFVEKRDPSYRGK
jgi:enoyl-CoA hydratase/carnithine racemase